MILLIIGLIEKKDYNKSIEKIQYHIAELKEDIKAYSKQLARNLISEELFVELTNENNVKIEQLEGQIDTLNEMIGVNSSIKKGIQSSIDLISQIIEGKELSDAHLEMLIDKIYIKENEDRTFDIDVNLNMPFKYHVDIDECLRDNN